MRLGILGGAFNPPHLGHLILAQEAFTQLSLDRVVFMPYGEPSHRVLEDDPGPEARLTMCEYAAGVDARFAVSRLEIDRGGPVYTVDTLRELRSRSPDDSLFVLLGGDQAAALGEWRAPSEVLSLATIAVAERDEWRRSSIVSALGDLCSPDRVRFFDMPRVEISSSLVRSRARSGLPIRYLVPDKVANYVGAQSLYGASEPAAGSGASGSAAATTDTLRGGAGSSPATDSSPASGSPTETGSSPETGSPTQLHPTSSEAAR